jgi:hypothetical protein
LAIDDVPSTDKLFRPILETLRVQNRLSVEGLVDALYDTDDLPPDESAEVDEVLWERVETALETLLYARAVKAGQFNRVQGLGSPASGWLAAVKRALHMDSEGEVVFERFWSITEHGRRISDDELALAFTKQCAEETSVPYHSPETGIPGIP